MRADEFQKGEKHMLSKLIMLSEKHNNINKFNEVMRNMFDQYEQVFEDEPTNLKY